MKKFILFLSLIFITFSNNSFSANESCRPGISDTRNTPAALEISTGGGEIQIHQKYLSRQIFLNILSKVGDGTLINSSGSGQAINFTEDMYVILPGKCSLIDEGNLKK